MGAFVVYIIKAAICLAILYLPYLLLMRKDSFFRFNRLILLGVVVLSFVLPAFDLPFLSADIFSSLNKGSKAIIEVGMPIPDGGKMPVAEVKEYVEEGAPVWPKVLVGVYFIGMVLCIIYKVTEYIRLKVNIRKGCLWTDVKDGVKIWCKAMKTSPYSWMNNIVVSEDDSESREIMLHESAHIRKGHSWDTLFVSAAEVLQWFNPCIWLLHLSLQEVHEYEADDCVLQSGVTAQQYQLLLIKKAVGSSSYTFANSFNHSLLKNRIVMMKQKKSSSWSRAKVLYILPSALIAMMCFATPAVQNTAETVAEPASIKSTDKVTNFVANDQISTEKIANQDLQSTADSRQLTEEVKAEDVVEVEEVPSVPEEITVTGTVLDDEGKPLQALNVTVVDQNDRIVANAITDKNGDFSLRCDNDNKFIVFSYVGYKTVKYKVENKVYKIKMEGGNDLPEIEVKNSEEDKEREVTFQVVEEMPEFPGGMQAMMKFIVENLKYPQAAIDCGFQTRALVKFVVEKDGTVSDVRCLKTSAEMAEKSITVTAFGDPKKKEMTEEEKQKLLEAANAINEEAMRVVKLMPKWKPGKQRGKNVRVEYTIPIMFRLN